MKMSHQSCKSFQHKHSLPKTSNDLHNLKTKSSCHAANAVHNCKPTCSRSMNTDLHCNASHKVRRLKTRRERNRVRGQDRNQSRTYNQNSRKEGGEKAQCRHIHPLSCSRKESTFAKPLIPQKPTIITEGRLTSIRGLFSHVVRSIDVERLVSDQIKKDKQKKEQRNPFMMLITSPLSPPVTLPQSDQDCTLDEVQKPLQEKENNTPPHVKRKKSSKKELIGKNTGIQTNRGDTGPIGLSREKNYRNANTRKEDSSSKTRQDSPSSPRETEHVVLPSLENDPVHQLCSFLNEKQAASQLSSGQRHKDCSSFSNAVENEDRCYSRNMEIWTDSAMQHDYLAEKVRLDLDRGASTKKRRIQEWNTSSPPFSLEEPQQPHTDMDCFKAQHHPSRHLFNQSQTSTQHAVPILRDPTWLDHPVNSYSQQQSMSTGESSKSVHLDLSISSQQCTEETDLNFNSCHLNESRTQKPQEPSFGGSRFWSPQQQVQDERERWAPFSFSASYLSEGFQYEPFFRCPRPSNTQRMSDWLGMTQCPRSNTPFYPPLYL